MGIRLFDRGNMNCSIDGIKNYRGEKKANAIFIGEKVHFAQHHMINIQIILIIIIHGHLNYPF